MHVYRRDSNLDTNLNTLENDGLQHDRPDACDIAQQYSSSTFVSLPFHTRKKKIGAP
jgi:hypothetical protein